MVDPDQRFQPLAEADEPIVVAYGAGVDSTAMLIGLRERRVAVDLILFADTGSEKPETYAYLPIIQSWLARNGMPPVTVLKRRSPRAGDTSLHGECLRKRVLPSLAYGGHSCSLKWKAEPQWTATRAYFGWNSRAQRWMHGPFITKLIGYDAGHETAAAWPKPAANGRQGITTAIRCKNGAGRERNARAGFSTKACRCRSNPPVFSVRPPRSTKSTGWPRHIPV